jgi:uncharacterized repeat protein (TIGR03803 family)
VDVLAVKSVKSGKCAIESATEESGLDQLELNLRLAKPRLLHIVAATLAFLLIFNLTTRSQVFGYSESALWNLGNGTDGVQPHSNLIADNSGNFYGTTRFGGIYGGGTVFELTPPSTIGGSWTEAVLWSFGNGTDGHNPYIGLTMDARGNLYGTTEFGGLYAEPNGGATVFELTPPSTAGGNWTESILWNFGNGADGFQIVAGLIIDAGGNLYGTTQCGGANGDDPFCTGTVFELTPPSALGGNWTESILWSFDGTDGLYPSAGLIMDAGGNLYGTTACGGTYGDCGNSDGGTVFELMPPSISGGKWTESVLWNFGNGIDGHSPYAGLIMDTAGNLYGTTGGGFNGPGGGTYNGGTAFELTPPSISGGNWTESILRSFGNGSDGQTPNASLIIDSGGNLYGTTKDGGPWFGGTAFELTPPSTAGGSWNESILWGFGNGTDGLNPDNASLTFDNSGNLYGTTGGGGTGGAAFRGGTAFEISPGGPETPTPVSTPTPPPTPANLTAAPSKLNFGDVVVTGTSKPIKVTLTNKGKVAAFISSVARNLPFTIAGGRNTCADSIAPKKTCSFYVEFAPTTIATVSGKSIYVTYNGTSPAVALAGNGIGVTLKAPKSASFPPTSPDSASKSKNIVFSNPSTVTVTFGTAVFGGSDPSSFRFAGDQCSGQPLAPKGKCSVGVEFAPPGNASGTQNATLSLGYTYGANNGIASVSLSGKVK